MQVPKSKCAWRHNATLYFEFEQIFLEGLLFKDVIGEWRVDDAANRCAQLSALGGKNSMILGSNPRSAVVMIHHNGAREFHQRVTHLTCITVGFLVFRDIIEILLKIHLTHLHFKFSSIE